MGSQTISRGGSQVVDRQHCFLRIGPPTPVEEVVPSRGLSQVARQQGDGQDPRRQSPVLFRPPCRPLPVYSAAHPELATGPLMAPGRGGAVRYA